MSTNDEYIITPNMNLGVQSPDENVMEENVTEKAKSKSQQRFFGVVDAYKKGELDSDEVSKSVKKAAKDMSMKQVRDFAKTKHKGLPNHVDESCDGKHPYSGLKHDMERAEKNSQDKPMNFNKKQTKLNENSLRKIIKEALQEISDDTYDNAYMKAMKDASILPYGTPKRVRRDAQAKNIKQLRNDKLNFDPIEVGNVVRQKGTTGNPSIDRKWATWQKNHNDRINGNRYYDKTRGRWVTKMSESQLCDMIKESVQTELVKTLSKYTLGKATSKEANKTIMDLANSNNNKVNESLDTKTANYFEEIKRGEHDSLEYNGQIFEVTPQLRKLAQQISEQFGLEAYPYVYQNDVRIFCALNIVNNGEDLNYETNIALRDELAKFGLHCAGSFGTRWMIYVKQINKNKLPHQIIKNRIISKKNKKILLFNAFFFL